MTYYEINMKHTESSITALAHMQYDLFCKSNRIAKSCICLVCFAVGAMNVSEWWGLLLICYGGYLMSSRYAAANRTASKLAKSISESGGEHPSSRYLFGENKMRVFTLPNESELDPLPYSAVEGLGEDLNAFYIFQSRYGGYMIPKSELGEKEREFRAFIEKKTGKMFISRRTRLPGVRMWLKNRGSEPEHL